MLTYLNPGVLEIYSRDDIIEILLEHETLQVAVCIGREAEFSDYGQDNMAISILRQEVYSCVGTKILGVITQFVARIKAYKIEGQTGVTGTNPTQCQHNGMVLSL